MLDNTYILAYVSITNSVAYYQNLKKDFIIKYRMDIYSTYNGYVVLLYICQMEKIWCMMIKFLEKCSI